MSEQQSGVTELQIKLELEGRAFDFNLCRKPLYLLLGAPIRQFWMDHSGKKLYRPFGPNGGNFQAILDLFWHVCGEYGLSDDQNNQQVYMQAQLLPFIRPIAAGRILLDAKLGKSTPRLLTKTLEEALRSSAWMKSKDSGDPRVACRNNTANLLHLPEKTAAEVELQYWAIEEALFQDIGVLLRTDPAEAFAEVKRRWGRLTKGIGRHRNHQSQKLALDYISYECKAAFFRCYSLAWSLIIPRLRKQFDLSPLEVKFLQFWHLEPSARSNRSDANFHLLHGHVFGLHPASSHLIRTRTGRELLGQYLRGAGEDDNQAALTKFLQAFVTAAGYYANAAEESRESRRGSREYRVGDATAYADDQEAKDYQHQERLFREE